MFCPNCSELKQNEDTQYCTTCGLDLNDLKRFVASGGSGFRRSKLRKGIEQGVKLMLLGVLLIPVWMFIAPAFPANDRLVESAPSTTWAEAVSWILMWMLFLAGAVRISYAFMFERVSNHTVGETPTHLLNQGEGPSAALPSGEEFQAMKPGGWKTTDELFKPVMRRPKTSGELR